MSNLGRNRLKATVLGIDVDILTMEETVTLVSKYISEKKPLHLMGVNADKLNQCQKDCNIKDIVENCGIINADGASVKLAIKYLYNIDTERVAGIDLMQSILVSANKKNYSVYFLGAKKRSLDKMIINFKEKFPNLNIVGQHDGYFSDDEFMSIKKELYNKQPDLVFVGITSPKKEMIIDDFMKNNINSVFMGVGGSFDVLSGEIRRAPKWMQNIHMEWLFRMLMEPRRLFLRYFIGNMLFIRNVYKQKRRMKSNG